MKGKGKALGEDREKDKKKGRDEKEKTLRKRRHCGEYHQLVQELRLDDGRLKAYFRTSQGHHKNDHQLQGVHRSCRASEHLFAVGYVVACKGVANFNY